MDIKKQLLTISSVANARTTAEFVLQQPECFKGLAEALTDDDKTLASRASWSISIIAESNPEMIVSQLDILIEKLNGSVHSGTNRNIYRALMLVNIPSQLQGEVLDLCLRDIADLKLPVAVRCNAMSTAANIAQGHPELAQEVLLVVREGSKINSPAYTARSQMVEAQLSRFTNDTSDKQ